MEAYEIPIDAPAVTGNLRGDVVPLRVALNDAGHAVDPGQCHDAKAAD